MSKADGLTSNYVSNISSWFWSHDKKKSQQCTAQETKKRPSSFLGKKKKIADSA